MIGTQRRAGVGFVDPLDPVDGVLSGLAELHMARHEAVADGRRRRPRTNHAWSRVISLSPGIGIDEEVVALGDDQPNVGIDGDGARDRLLEVAFEARRPDRRAVDSHAAQQGEVAVAIKGLRRPCDPTGPRRCRLASARWKPSIGTDRAAATPRSRRPARSPRRLCFCRRLGAPAMPTITRSVLPRDQGGPRGSQGPWPYIGSGHGRTPEVAPMRPVTGIPAGHGPSSTRVAE